MRPYPFFILAAMLLVSCDRPNSSHDRQPSVPPGQSTANDSVQVLKLLKDVYRWHDKHQYPVDFTVTVQDSFQTGLNYDSFNVSFNALKQTSYFSLSFINNYEKIAEHVNEKLTKANPKLFNEINFRFQEADPWTDFQDDAPSFWDSLTISDYKAAADSASLKWKIVQTNWSTAGYVVKFSKENGQWKVAYLEGFDPVDCFK